MEKWPDKSFSFPPLGRWQPQSWEDEWSQTLTWSLQLQLTFTKLSCKVSSLTEEAESSHSSMALFPPSSGAVTQGQRRWPMPGPAWPSTLRDWDGRGGFNSCSIGQRWLLFQRSRAGKRKSRGHWSEALLRHQAPWASDLGAVSQWPPCLNGGAQQGRELRVSETNWECNGPQRNMLFRTATTRLELSQCLPPLLATCLRGRCFSSCQLSTLFPPPSSSRLAKHQPLPSHLRAKIGTARGYLHMAVTNTDEMNFNFAYLCDCLLACIMSLTTLGLCSHKKSSREQKLQQFP